MKILFVLSLIALAFAYPPNKLYKNDETKLDWWQNTVYYQIYPRSFKDSDGDGIGDIQGIISKLDYLEELGVGGTWISPVFKSPMVDFGYDISDFYDIDPTFGTMADIEELFEKANARGLKIILDFVPNHTSDQCEWFQKSVKRIEPYTDYYVWHDGKVNAKGERVPPNNWNQVFYGSAWTWVEERQQFYYHTFTPQQPDMNFNSTHVVEEMKNVLRFWVKKGAAGFRVDATDHIFEAFDFRDQPLSGKTNDTKDYGYHLHIATRDQPANFEIVYQWREVLDSLKSVNGGYSKILMAETYANNSHMQSFFQSPDGKRQGANVPLNNLLIDRTTEYTNASELKALVDYGLKYVPEGKWVSWIVSNHDKHRIGTKMGEGKIDCYNTLVMTLPGIAITYQGEEIGMLDYRTGLFFNQTIDPQGKNLGPQGRWREKSRDPVRTPFQWDNTTWAGFSQGTKAPWLPVHPNYHEINLAQQKRAKRSTFKYWRKLVTLREEPTLIFGDYESKALGINVLAFKRSLPQHETYVILLNFGSNEDTINVNDIVDGFGDHVEVVLASPETPYNEGDILPTKAVFLRKHNVVILKRATSAPSSANSSSVISFISSILSIILLRILF